MMVEGEGFEPSKAEPSDLQSDPFDRSGTPPNDQPKRLIMTAFSPCVKPTRRCALGWCAAAKHRFFVAFWAGDTAARSPAPLCARGRCTRTHPAADANQLTSSVQDGKNQNRPQVISLTC